MFPPARRSSIRSSSVLAGGHTDAVVAYRNEPWDLLGGLEIAREAGGVVSMSKDREIILVGKKTAATKLAVLLGQPDPPTDALQLLAVQLIA
ncbi:MAG: hypothetical protein ACXWXF_04010 [Aeromicrobium sp.]